MNEQSFVQRREVDWKRLEILTDRADGSIRRLTSLEVRELVKLYRRASTDLALARTRSANLGLIEYLNDLVGKAYGVLYRSPRTPLLASLVGSAALSARTVRKYKWFVALSALLFFGSAVLTNVLLAVRPDITDVFEPAGMKEAFETWKSGKMEERTGSIGSMMTGFYASNNPKTAIVAGAAGAGTFGVLSVILVAQNGAILGALAHELQPVGKVGHLITWISPHGVPELSGIIVSGAVGMALGWALINPGRRTRGEALRVMGRDAITLLATSVVLMLIAAPIEGFFSFNPRVPDWLKITVAISSFVAWMMFWSSFGKEGDEAPARI